MRILIENNAYAPYVSGGAELSVQGIAEGLVKRGNEVWVLTAGRRDEEDHIAGVSVVRRRFAGLMPYADHRASKRSFKKLLNKPLTLDNPMNAPIIDAVFDRARPEVTLSNNLMGVTPQFWRSAKRFGAPIMHTTRDYALMCPNSVLACRRHPTCQRPLPLCSLMRWHMRGTSELVDVVCAPSRYALDQHVNRGYFPRARGCVIPNAVHFDEPKVDDAVSLRKADKGNHPLRVCFLGRLSQEKGVLVLVGALCELWQRGIDVELHLAGSGPLEGQLQELASEGVPLVLHGFLSQDEVGRLLLASDVLVAPSLIAETFGRVVLDAYAHAMPAIVSDMGALPEVLREGTGTVVAPNNGQALAMAIEGYAKNPALVLDQGIAGARALRSFAIERQVQRFEEELRRLVETRG